MDITIGVTVSDDLKDTAVARIEELLVKTLMRDNTFIMSAVILRLDEHGLNTLNYQPDNNTRMYR